MVPYLSMTKLFHHHNSKPLGTGRPLNIGVNEQQFVSLRHIWLQKGSFSNSQVPSLLSSEVYIYDDEKVASSRGMAVCATQLPWEASLLI